MQKRLQAFENKSHRNLQEKYQEKKTNVYVKEKMIAIIGKYDPLLHMIKLRKLKWYGHISRNDGLSKTIIGIVEGSRKQGRPKSQWFNNISDWTKMDANQLLHTVHDRDGWRKCVVKAERIPLTIDSPYDFRVTGLKVKVSNRKQQQLFI